MTTNGKSFWIVTFGQSIRTSSLRLTLLAVLTGLLVQPAVACLFVEEWQAKPRVDTIQESTDIYLARLQDYEETSDLYVQVRLHVLLVLKGKDLPELSLTLEKTGDPARDLTALKTGDHTARGFWTGELTNASLRADCQYAPLRLQPGQTYLVLLTDGKITTAVGFEPITELSTDAWLKFVQEQLSTSESIDPKLAECP